MIRKILKSFAIAGALLIIAIPLGALLYRTYRQHAVAEERAIRSLHGIASLERVPIGGIGQWIEVRGENVDNPILLWIHGGPGVAFIPLAGAFQGPLEKQFTVAQWDQRGAGKTYASNDQELQRATMNMNQMEQDTLEIVNYRFQRGMMIRQCAADVSVISSGCSCASRRPSVLPYPPPRLNFRKNSIVNPGQGFRARPAAVLEPVSSAIDGP